MARGDLVPEQVTIAMGTRRIQEEDAQAGFLLDGFPRNLPQPETLKKLLSGWDTCRGCGRVWHATFDPPSRRDRCDDCDGELFQRDDDREETIRHRLDVYAQQTQPLIAFYADNGTLLGIDATGPVEEITDRALAALRRFIR